MREGNIEEAYEDVLQNFETAIIIIYRQTPQLTDYSVMEALDVVVRSYEAQARGRETSPRPLPPLDQEVADALRLVCEWRLGRKELKSESGKKIKITDDALTLEEIIACLKRIQKSVKRWNKSHGRRGYLEFVKDYIP